MNIHALFIVSTGAHASASREPSLNKSSSIYNGAWLRQPIKREKDSQAIYREAAAG